MMGTEVTVAATDLRFETPLYTFAEAARALGVPSRTFTDWAKGYRRRRPDRPAIVGGPVVTALAVDRGTPAIPFIGLAEGMVLAALRKADVPLQRVRPALEVLRRELGLDHALASRRLYTDGAEVLFDYAEDSPSDEAAAVRQLVVVRNKQHVFTEIVLGYLQRITYGDDGYAVTVRLPAYERAEVIVDPERSFGQPIFAQGGARVSDVLERFLAGDDVATLTQEFGVPAPDVEDALRAASRHPS